MRFFRWLVIGFFLLVVALAISAWGVYRASQAVPEFYQQALQFEPEDADKAGDQLEQQVVELHNELEQGESWQLELTAEQINGWLATDLPEKFPGLLPAEVEEPRIAFQDGLTQVACRLNTPKIKTVLSMALDAYLTDQPNEIAIRIDRVRAGMVPVPLKRILDRAASEAARGDLRLRWAQDDGDPVAIIQFSTDREELRSGVVIESVRVEDGKVVVSGRADGSASSAQQDHSSVIPFPVRLVDEPVSKENSQR